MKKAVVLFASPHENGATKKLLDAFLGGLESSEWETQLFDVCKMPVKPCAACGYCQRVDGCAFRDLDAFDAALRACDLLVIASPVYNLTFPAQLKSVLDRFQRYFEARFARGIKPAIAKPRQAALLLTMGRSDPLPAEICGRMLRQSFSVMNTKLFTTLCLENTDGGVDEKDPIFEKARAMAIEIAQFVCYNNSDISE